MPAGADLEAIAPILCAGVTTYKGLKETEAQAGDWVVISGIGGLGHVAVQYAKAMGFSVVALDVDPAKLDARASARRGRRGDCRDPDAVRPWSSRPAEMHGVLVTAVSTAAFSQAIGISGARARSCSTAFRRANSRRR